ncbi:MAG: hypothetical protein WCJ29_02650 [bacterium]
MSENKTRGTTLFCFSPPVILATFLIELGLGIWAFIKYRSSRLGKLAIVLLFLLSFVQLTEWMICKSGPNSNWTQLNFLGTLFLPVITIDFIGTFLKRRGFQIAWYSIAAAFAIIIIFSPGIFRGGVCTGRFVALETRSQAFDLGYGIYYISSLFYGIGLCLMEWKNPKNRQALGWILGGYAVFIIPTLFVYIFTSITQAAFPSILCGFAILLALILAGKILPAVHAKNL